jgi:hypothetical protein
MSASTPAAVPTRAPFAGSPAAFLMTLAFLNMLGFAGWQALLNNFTVEKAAFGWYETGLTQSVREIPGFLAFTMIFWILWLREQTLAYLALLLTGLGVALTGYFPTLTGVLVTTFVMSVGFHYFETVNQSLQLQLLHKAQAPYIMGRIRSAGAAAQVVCYGAMGLFWWLGWRNYAHMFLALGLLCMALCCSSSTASFSRSPSPRGPISRRSATRPTWPRPPRWPSPSTTSPPSASPSRSG